MKRKANLAKERAKVKAQKEEQERNARPQTVTNLNALDIPAELASIFNKIEGKIHIAFVIHFNVFLFLFVIFEKKKITNSICFFFFIYFK